MNETMRTIHAHRSIRAYTDEPIPIEDVRAAVAAGQAAATSSAVQAASVIRVTEARTRAGIAQRCGPQEKVAQAPEFLVFCADSRRHRLLAQREGNAYDQRLEAFLVGVIDATLLAQNTTLAFESMGYGTCYIGGLRNEIAEVDRLLELPDGVFPLYGLCVGSPAQDPAPRPRLPLDAVLFDDRYPEDEAVLGAIESYDETYSAYLTERGAPTDAIERAWSRSMAGKFDQPSRAHLAGYYASKGARLD